MNNKICIIREKNASYPDKDTLFRPSNTYPENPFCEEVAVKENKVYDMVRRALFSFGLDIEHYEQPSWNPLGVYIKPNDSVLIKPNLVYHDNGERGTKCLYTHPSVVAAIIDYVIIALKSTGNIIVADAPLQECDFNKLVDDSGYKELIKFYQNKKVNIKLVDMRNNCTQVVAGILFPQEGREPKNKGVQINLGNESAFSQLDEKRMRNFRVTDFDPRILQEHHTVDKHEYLIAQEVINADVVINIPKPKTHRKAGITAALKNLIGINASKEYLPHHTNGSAEEGGDAYKYQDSRLNKANDLLDKRNLAIADKNYQMAKEFFDEYDTIVSCEEKKQRYWEGSWYGNDTIWRTVSDLNKILYYSDKNGHIQDKIQRKVIIISDMVIAGHQEGPLAPSPINSGVIAVADHPLVHDRAICSIMGFDYEKIPSTKATELKRGKCTLSCNENIKIISNCREWNESTLSDIRDKYSLGFVPSKGWEIVLGNKEKENFATNIQNINKEVIIFGAGLVGIDFALYLQEKYPSIKIIGFYDNNPGLWGMEIIPGVHCIKPEIIDRDYVCVIATRKNNTDVLKIQAKRLGFKTILCWSED